MTVNRPLDATPLRARLHEIIFESDTQSGKWFDVGLMVAIGLSVIVVMLDSVPSAHAQYEPELAVAEWFFTVLFTIEYVLRLYCVGKPLRYATSFFGIVDLLAIVPTPLSALFPRAGALSVVRTLRILRVFRVLKLVHYLHELRELGAALHASRRKITVFLCAVLTIAVILGSLMYVIEGHNPGTRFSSIPQSVYWAIVTLTTVGYGDLSPDTPLGKAMASVIMILGYSILAVPTGIISVEIARVSDRESVSGQACPECSGESHAIDAKHCKYCGARL